ncbi:C40 family peptidase [Thiomonas intermedia]|uniref:C40 family peptidase n=1 Tax=Thiomonas intermedia TaxID=926 RepID=UPI0009A55664|nr:C40 family peptidase [Thiomonas intermedia]
MRVNPLFVQIALACCLLGSASAWADPAALPQVNPAQPSEQAVRDVQNAQRDDSPLRQWLTQNGFVQQVSTRASDLVVNALSFLGVKYRYGGDSARSGFDCSGFVRYVYEETLGTVLPHNAAQQAREGEKIPESQLRPGDLVFFNTLRRAFSHVGIYIGNGQFIHAPRSGQTIRVENLDSPYWAKRFDGARRIVTGQQTEVAQDDATSPSANPPGPSGQ